MSNKGGFRKMERVRLQWRSMLNYLLICPLSFFVKFPFPFGNIYWRVLSSLLFFLLFPEGRRGYIYGNGEVYRCTVYIEMVGEGDSSRKMEI